MTTASGPTSDAGGADDLVYYHGTNVAGLTTIVPGDTVGRVNHPGRHNRTVCLTDDLDTAAEYAQLAKGRRSPVDPGVGRATVYRVRPTGALRQVGADGDIGPGREFRCATADVVEVAWQERLAD